MSAPTTDHPHDTDIEVIRAKTLRGLLLARELDAARNVRGYTTRQTATMMSMSPAMFNRVMTGRRVPTDLEIGGLCSVLDIPADRRPCIYQLTADADLTDWLLRPDTHGDPIREIEDIADSITWYDPTWIPHPLRTPAYDHAVNTTTGAHPIRTGRTGLTTRISTFLLHPNALLHPGVSEAMLREQLRHLLDTHLDKVRLTPATTSPQPGFRVLHIDHFPPVVHIEHHRTTLLLEREPSTASHIEFLRTLTTVPLAREHATQTLHDLADTDGPA